MTAEWTVIVSREVRQWFDQQAQADQIIVRKLIEPVNFSVYGG